MEFGHQQNKLFATFAQDKLRTVILVSAHRWAKPQLQGLALLQSLKSSGWDWWVLDFESLPRWRFAGDRPTLALMVRLGAI